MYKILFVCVGATCRSPMASYLFNKKVKDYNLSGVNSSFCGLNVEYDSKINFKSVAALKKYGIIRTRKKPTQISFSDLVSNNLIVCLTEDYKEALIVSAGDKFKDKIYCTKDFCGFDVLDPYGGTQEEYDSCLQQIDVAIEKIIGVLVGNGIAKHKPV
ncbi:MAG: hypothetical protein IJ542_02230 [Clostridia bacterium]|nr:hypothetical protein [Clostridia bacterium]